MKDIKNSNKITCPACGKEYILEEVFLKSDIFGNPDIVRDGHDRKIDEVFGKKASLESDEFECDCGCRFKAKAHITFDTVLVDDFKEDF